MKFVDADLYKIGDAWRPFNLKAIPTFIVLNSGEEAARVVTGDILEVKALADEHKAGD